LERPEPKIREAVERDDVIALTRLLELEKSRKDDVFFGRLLKLALLRSAEVGNLSTIKLALQFGAKTDALPSRQSPLLRAILCGHHEIVPLLVDAGASVNERDRNGRTPLMIAALRYDPNAVDLLLYLGADVDIRDEGGKTVLHHVAAEPLEIPAWGFVVLRRIIQTTAQIDAKDANGRTVLHWACAMGKERLAHMLLSPETGKRADISMTESLSRTPLHLAVSHGHKSVVSLLLTYGADVNAQSAGGWTPLHIVRIGISSKVKVQRALTYLQPSGMPESQVKAV
jgi:ankyrin repeat protein